MSGKMVKVYLDGKEIKQENIKDGFYLYRLASHSFSSVPRREKGEILKIINRAKEDVYLIAMDFPIAYFGFRRND